MKSSIDLSSVQQHQTAVEADCVNILCMQPAWLKCIAEHLSGGIVYSRACYFYHFINTI